LFNILEVLDYIRKVIVYHYLSLQKTVIKIINISGGIMMNLKKLVNKAQSRDKSAMSELIKQFNPLLKKQAGYFSQMGLEYEDVYQQAALLFITGVYQYKEIPPVTFPGYIKKRIKWGLWMYWRKQKSIV